MCQASRLSELSSACVMVSICWVVHALSTLWTCCQAVAVVPDRAAAGHMAGHWSAVTCRFEARAASCQLTCKRTARCPAVSRQRLHARTRAAVPPASPTEFTASLGQKENHSNITAQSINNASCVSDLICALGHSENVLNILWLCAAAKDEQLGRLSCATGLQAACVQIGS